MNKNTKVAPNPTLAFTTNPRFCLHNAYWTIRRQTNLRLVKSQYWSRSTSELYNSWTGQSEWNF